MTYTRRFFSMLHILPRLETTSVIGAKTLNKKKEIKKKDRLKELELNEMLLFLNLSKSFEL